MSSPDLRRLVLLLFSLLHRRPDPLRSRLRRLSWKIDLHPPTGPFHQNRARDWSLRPARRHRDPLSNFLNLRPDQAGLRSLSSYVLSVALTIPGSSVCSFHLFFRPASPPGRLAKRDRGDLLQVWDRREVSASPPLSFAAHTALNVSLIQNSSLASSSHIVDARTRTALKTAYVDFARPEDASEAVRSLHGQSLVILFFYRPQNLI